MDYIHKRGDIRRVSDSSIVGESLESYFSWDSKKDEILDKIHLFEDQWQKIVLNAPSVTLDQAKKDFRRQKVILNGVSFVPDLFSSTDLFSTALTKLCQILMRICPLEKITYEEIAETILQRSCRSGTGADSFFAVHSIFSIQDTIVTQYTTDIDDAIEIIVYANEGTIWACANCRNTYSLIDASLLGNSESSMNDSNISMEIPHPWLYVDTFIRHDFNFVTGENKRTLRIKASQKPPENNASSMGDVDFISHCSGSVDIKKHKVTLSNQSTVSTTEDGSS